MAVPEKHEDEELQFCFQDEDVEMLESYDEDLEGYEVFEPSDDANGLEELTYMTTVCMNPSYPVKNSDVLMPLLMTSR